MCILWQIYDNAGPSKNIYFFSVLLNLKRHWIRTVTRKHEVTLSVHTWSHCRCTTLPVLGSCSKLCSVLLKHCPSGWTLRTGYTRLALWERKSTVTTRAIDCTELTPLSPITWLHLCCFHSPFVSENSRRSSSLRGKLTYVESLVLWTLKSEKRFRSEWAAESRNTSDSLLCF